MTRAIREKKAYDEGNISEISHRWHMRAIHVFECQTPRVMKKYLMI